jgi:IS30 family transposase
MTISNSNTKVKKYKHLSYEERCKIETLLEENYSLRKIAKRLNRSVSTISNEVKRGTTTQMDSLRGTYTIYAPTASQNKYYRNRKNSGKKSKFINVQEFLKFAEEKILEEKWSPDAIVGFVLKNELFSKDEIVCAKTLYNYIDDRLLKARNIHLCDKVKRSPKKSKKDKIHQKHFGKSIDERDPKINDRLEIGHWEIDLVILGKKKSEALLTLVERKSRKLIVEVVNNRTSAEICRVLANILNKYPKEVFKTITADNGSEFAKLTEVFEEVYYAHPYSSYERGTNERHNGLIRRFVPKGTTFKDTTIEAIKKVEEWCNSLPRKILSYATPEEIFNIEIKKLA